MQNGVKSLETGSPFRLRIFNFFFHATFFVITVDFEAASASIVKHCKRMLTFQFGARNSSSLFVACPCLDHFCVHVNGIYTWRQHCLFLKDLDTAKFTLWLNRILRRIYANMWWLYVASLCTMCDCDGCTWVCEFHIPLIYEISWKATLLWLFFLWSKSENLHYFENHFLQ